jgi:hypothetical protein
VQAGDTGVKQDAAVRITLKHVFLASFSIALLFLLAVFILEFFKPRLSVTAILLPNNTVVISGRLTCGLDPVPNQYVAMEVRSQSGETVWRDVVRTFADGSFKSVFALKPDAGGVSRFTWTALLQPGRRFFKPAGGVEL